MDIPTLKNISDKENTIHLSDQRIRWISVMKMLQTYSGGFVHRLSIIIFLFTITQMKNKPMDDKNIKFIDHRASPVGLDACCILLNARNSCWIK